MGDKRPASPSDRDGGKSKKSRRGSGRGRGGRGGFYGGPPPPGMRPPWGPPPPPPGFLPRPPPPPPFPGRRFGYYPPPGDDYDFELMGGHRDDWLPGQPPPPPGETPSKPSVKTENFADDDYAIFGAQSFGRGGGSFRGRRGNDRGRGRQSRFDSDKRGQSSQGRGGPANRGNRGGQSNRGGQTQTKTATTGATPPRGRGRGQAQRGMPPYVFDWRQAKARKDAKKAAKKAADAAAGITPTMPPVHSLAKFTLDVTNMSPAEKIQNFQSLTIFCARFVWDLVRTQIVGFLMHRLINSTRVDAVAGITPTMPPVHSLAKVALDVTNMSPAEKIHRFSLYVRSDPMKENAIQHLTNATTGSKLMIKIDYEAEELAKVGSKHMHTGCLKLAGVFLARAVSVNRKELKHLVFQKALNVLLTKTVAEIYNLVDPGVDTLREELEREEELENTKKDMRSRDWMGQDIAEAFQIIIDKLKNNTQVVDSDISRIEQAIVAVQCVIRHQYNMDTVKHKNGRVTFKGSLEINNIIVGRATAANKKGCKRQTYTNALERLLTNSIEDLMIPVPEEVEPEPEEEPPKPPKPPRGVKPGFNLLTMSKREKFSELIKTLKTLPFKESNINSIDVTAMQFGIVPMAVYRKLDKKRDTDDCLTCELYLDHTLITSADGRKRNPAKKEAYNKAWELLTTTDIDTLLTQHAVITAEELKARDVADIIVKGGGKTTESNMAGLRRNFNKDERCLNLKKDEIVIVEHADWSNDRMRNSFAILQCSCTQNGMLMQWTMEGGNNNFLYISRRDDSKTWIPWQKVVDEAQILKKQSPEEEDESETPKTDEKGFFLPDKYLVEVMSQRLEKFAGQEGFEEVIFGPGMPATESREIKIVARELKLTVDIRQHLGEPYLIFYKKLNYPDLVQLLKKRKRPYGKYELVPRDQLPKHADVVPIIKAAEGGLKKVKKDEDSSDDD